MEFECVWNGRDGWVGQPGERGALLPPYDSRPSLGMLLHRSPIAGRPPVRRRKYDDAVRKSVHALRANGLILADIAKRLRLPIGTVYHILHHGEDR